MKVFQGNNPGDGVGNRRSHKEIQIPNDNIGNHLEIFRTNENTPDNLGNSIDIAPTHQLSGITHRKKADAAPLVRMGRYLVGGVNPAVAGLAHLIPDEAPVPQQRTQNQETTGAAPASGPQVDKRLRRLFEFDEDDRVEYTLTSTPEEKRSQAELAMKTIFEAGELPAAEITTILEQSETKSNVLVTVNSPVFKAGDLPLAALNFLVNKIVNRLPSDRIRLIVRAPATV